MYLFYRFIIIDFFFFRWSCSILIRLAISFILFVYFYFLGSVFVLVASGLFFFNLFVS